MRRTIFTFLIAPALGWIALCGLVCGYGSELSYEEVEGPDDGTPQRP